MAECLAAEIDAHFRELGLGPEAVQAILDYAVGHAQKEANTLRTKADLEWALIAQGLTIAARDALLRQMAEALREQKKYARKISFNVAMQVDNALAAYEGMVGKETTSKESQ